MSDYIIISDLFNYACSSVSARNIIHILAILRWRTPQYSGSSMLALLHALHLRSQPLLSNSDTYTQLFPYSVCLVSFHSTALLPSVSLTHIMHS